MHRFGVIVIGVIVVGLLTGAGVLLAPYVFPRKPDRPAGPLKVSVHELSLPISGNADAPPIAVRIWAAHDAAIAHSYPLILYVPGWGGSRGESDVLLFDIASAGFVVAAADDISRDKGDTSADPADEQVRVGPFKAFSPQDLAAFPEASERRIRLGLNKVDKLLDALMHLKSGDLPSAIDFSRIGVVGFSFGGAVASVSLVRNPRVAAAVNLDGWVVDTPAASGVSRPLLAIYAKVDLHLSPAQASTAIYSLTKLAREDFRALLDLSRSSAAEVRLVDGVEHGDFTDALYTSRWKRWRPWRPRIIRPDHMRAIMQAYLVPFLLQNVSGRPPATSGFRVFPEVTSIEAIEPDLQ